jgi:hypothetical protein
MEFSKDPLDTTTGSQMEELQQSYQNLRNLLNIVLVMMIILTGSVLIFLLREVSISRRKVQSLTQYVAQYEATRQPLVFKFQRDLQEFAKAYPDFRPILDKYFGPTNIARGLATAAPQFDLSTNVARMPVTPKN